MLTVLCKMRTLHAVSCGNTVQSIYQQYIQSPIGVLRMEASDRALISLHFVEGDIPEHEKRENEITIATALQLEEYFEGKRKRFGIPLQLKGTEFQYHVWDALKGIDFGETISYMDLAKRIHKPDAVRAVGTANGDNKIPILLPCHRVIGGKGNLVGYAGGLWRKKWLIEHEQKVCGKLLSLF